MITQRFDLEVGENKLSLPPNAIFLHFANVREVPRLWVSLEPEDKTNEVLVWVQHTGALVPDGGSYVGTAITTTGELHAWCVEAARPEPIVKENAYGSRMD